jgi:hypothetical protein
MYPTRPLRLLVNADAPVIEAVPAEEPVEAVQSPCGNFQVIDRQGPNSRELALESTEGPVAHCYLIHGEQEFGPFLCSHVSMSQDIYEYGTSRHISIDFRNWRGPAARLSAALAAARNIENKLTLRVQYLFGSTVTYENAKLTSYMTSLQASSLMIITNVQFQALASTSPPV